jgi:sodium/potassium-transporting ATPase subunit alpha
LKELTGWFALLLWAGGILNIVGYYLSLSSSPDPSDLYLGIVLFLIVIGTAIFSYAQTSKSAEIMAQFENFIPPTAFVKRDGRDQKIDAKLIVPGDIIIISTGENIPCDIVIFQSNEMKVNNASLTGESEDIHVDPDLPPNDNILETKNAGFFGTSCTAGSGKGICIRTGDATVIGQIANLASSAETNETPI